MKKNLLYLVLSVTLLSSLAFAENLAEPPIDGNFPPKHDFAHKKPTKQDFKKMDKFIEQRLNLSDEQIKILKSKRQKNIKELEKIIAKMEINHKKIRDIYLLGLPKYQADIKSAPYKMELVMLKQNADSIRNQNRKEFEAILTNEQKAEFKKLKNELPKRPPLR